MASAAKICCRIQHITDHGAGVYTLDLQPSRPVPRFVPGQFLHLAIDEYDPSSFWPDSRVFSIASSPNQRDLLRITYSVVGHFTRRMEAELSVGKSVWVKLPYGDFCVHAQRQAVLFAGGTGVTAFTAYIESLPTLKPAPVQLFYGARKPELLLYQGLIDQIAAETPYLQVVYFCEEGVSEVNPASNQRLGRLSVSSALPFLKNPLGADYYLSGPPAMLKALTQQLSEHNIQPQAIHIDAW